jgi:hypothetical protein
MTVVPSGLADSLRVGNDGRYSPSLANPVTISNGLPSLLTVNVESGG